MKLRLAEQYLKTISKLGKEENEVLLPADLTRYESVIDGLSLDEFTLRTDGEAPSPAGDGAPDTDEG